MKTAKKPSQPKVAIVYDRLNSSGGAEKILQALQQLYPDAPFYTSVYDSESVPWLSPKTEVHTSWLQHIPGAKKHHQWFGWLMPFLFEQFEFSEYDIIISVSSESAKGVLTQPKQLHINYVLTPTRYLWSHSKEYEAQVPSVLRPVMSRVVRLLKEWDAVASYRADVMVPISRVVQERVKKYYKREITEPIYPPFDIEASSQAPKDVASLPKEYFFTWGRHVRYKEFETSIRASVSAQIPLVIAGNGPDTTRLKQIARELDPQASVVQFVGNISDAEIRWHLERALGSVFPQIEDFGIVIMESLLAGCPVLVHQKTGAAELMNQNDGVFLPEISPRILAELMQEMRSTVWKRLDIQRRARQYAGVRFSQEWSRFVEEAWEKHTQNLHQKTERNV